MFRIHKSIETKSKLAVAMDWGEEWEVTASGYGISFWSDKNVIKLDSGYGCCMVCKYTKSY